MRSIFRGEDEARFVPEFLADVAPRYFVDVGAADPQVGSQSWELEQAGWSGILVEPRPEMAEKLRKVRRARVFETACSSPQKAGRTMPLKLRGGYSTLNDKMVIAGMPAQGAIPVEVSTLDSILRDADAPRPLGFVSIDVEGHEVEVLKGFDLDYWRPQLVLIEDHVLSLRLHKTLKQRGYKWVRRTGLNAWYVPANSPMRVGWLGWLQFFRKYHLEAPTRAIRDAVRILRAATGILPPTRGR